MEYLTKTYKAKNRTFKMYRAGIQPRTYNKIPAEENIIGPLAVYLLLCECSAKDNKVKMAEKAIATHLRISEASVKRYLKKLYGWKLVRKHATRAHIGKGGELVTEINTYEIYEGKNKSNCLYWQLKDKYDAMGRDKAAGMVLYALIRSKLEDMPVVNVSTQDLVEMTGAGRNVILRIMKNMTDVRLIVRIKGKGKAKSQIYFTNEFLYDLDTQAMIRTTPESSVYLKSTTVESYKEKRGELEREKWKELKNQLEILKN